MPKASGLAYVATVLALLGIVWQAAIQWQELTDRVRILEKEATFFHGPIPKEAK